MTTSTEADDNFLAFFIVASNLVYLAPAWLLWHWFRYRFIWEIGEFALVTLISGIYHMCDTPSIGLCASSFAILYYLDNLFALWAITNAVTPFIGFKSMTLRIQYRVVMFLVTFILTFVDMPSFHLAIPVIAALNLCTLTASLYYIHSRRSLYSRIKDNNPQSEPEDLESLPTPIHTATVLFISGCMAGVAIAFFVLDSDRGPGTHYYQGLHSAWHICTGVAVAILFFALPSTKAFEKYSNPCPVDMVAAVV